MKFPSNTKDHDLTHHDHLLQRQIELEIEMSGLGRDRYLSRVRKNIDKERGYETDTGRCILEGSVPLVAEGVSRFIEDAYSGRPGPRAVAARLIKDMDFHVVAYLACRAILARMMKPRAPVLLTLAVSVARSVELEARFTEFHRQNKDKFLFELKRLSDDGATEQHKATVLTYAMGKSGIPWDRWSRTDMIQLGIRMIELFCEQTGLATIEQANEGGSTDNHPFQYLVHLTDRANAWIEQSVRGGEHLFPDFLPTLIPPKEWTGLSGGGYYTDLDRPLPLVRRARPDQLRLLQKADLTKVLRGLNAIQQTPWQINGAILDVMMELAKSDAGIAGLVPGDKPLPERPPNIDTDADVLREWKWAARDVYAENLQLRQDRLKQQQMFDLAERFRAEPAIYFPHNLDFRGRAYPVPDVLNPQGSDPVKALLRFTEGKPLGHDGERWLAIHGANTFGVDKVSFDERVKWVWDNNLMIQRCAVDPLENLWWTEADKPWCFLAFCFEWDQYRNWPETFVSHLPIALDGSCNGLQHFSAMLLDSVGGAAVNLIPAKKPQDIYQVVADRVMAQLRLIVSYNGVDPETESAAKTWEEDARHAYKMGRPLPEVTTTVTKGGGRIETLKDLLDMVKVDWELDNCKSTAKMYRNGELFLEWFGAARHPSEVTEITFDDYVQHLRSEGRAGATINRRLSPIRMILKKAKKRRMISDLPETPLFDESKGSLNWLDFGQEDPIIGHLNHRARGDLVDLVTFLIDTGARITETLSLEWRTIRPTVVVFENRKNGNMMGVPLTKRAQAALIRRRAACTNPEGPFKDINPDQARRVLQLIYKKLGGEYAKITQPFHVFRHSCASRMATRGVDAKRIKEWMDHASFITTERYMKLAPSALELAASALEPEGMHPALKVVA
ncbi:DNA-directed RNA polymerase [Mesorhizobium sp.]|uniref:DNA-directed RNA polymerase n=1 Tax=Mesorhizobium sp. TaxID=1871066 RepID=UPI000FE700CF|nr:DNA-directed RNA polymerase [Mesorhizobium sp.]RWM72882.1 MAG: hypothetical protein EOR82_12100 [Mesorhizobium sp.]TIO22936.1 MAG: hypothetical protein E5X83_22860 [Mesorhizobium sp.]TJV57377.1 MAG: hypothetical protein E5X82_21955 [Mesorhizobium sp.]